MTAMIPIKKSTLNAFENSEAHKVKLEMFEGPLDLLLHLVRSAEIEIKDIFVSQITEQYLILMSDVSSLDLDGASDFIAMAAYLIEIKSRSLLPKEAEELTAAEDPTQELINRLEEYKLFKEAAEKLQPLESVDRFWREPDASLSEGNFVLGDMTIEGLVGALDKMLTRMERRAEVHTGRKIVLDRFTVAEKMSHIKEYMFVRKRAVFSELFESDYSKSEVISTFLALLELLKLQQVKVVQSDTYGEIDIDFVGDDPEDKNNTREVELSWT